MESGRAATRADVPVAQRRPGGDAGAEQRRHGFNIQIFWNFQHEGVADGDALRVAAVGGLAVVAVVAVVGVGRAVFAILL